ncbi:hypothetical protein EXE59_13400 [Nocardioides eburneiflavus]|uniref:Uncharacterized protein n=1 Tax=Nocardioides eburneiflavus TaxID=2518372 RepID=A0A4Z1C3L4_9ACTN|nr:hypothetical protein [Nocardioides eburneiflavus]TGN64844.1 hypothetical protein EXE59_13400 [Nocardioides eburneiflavus]
MIEQVTLRDGTDAFVVPLERTDRAQLVAEFEHLSPESQRRRFLAPVHHLSDAMLDHLVDHVDGIDHVALVLCPRRRTTSTTRWRWRASRATPTPPKPPTWP